jgi:hypothetical protein
MLDVFWVEPVKDAEASLCALVVSTGKLSCQV